MRFVSAGNGPSRGGGVALDFAQGKTPRIKDIVDRFLGSWKPVIEAFQKRVLDHPSAD